MPVISSTRYFTLLLAFFATAGKALNGGDTSAPDAAGMVLGGA